MRLVGRSGAGSGGHQTKLSEQSNLVEPSPAFNDLVVLDPKDLDALEDEGLPRRGNAHQLAAMGAARSETFDDEVSLGHELINLAVPVW